jgi:hypothetical protein
LLIRIALALVRLANALVHVDEALRILSEGLRVARTLTLESEAERVARFIDCKRV